MKSTNGPNTGQGYVYRHPETPIDLFRAVMEIDQRDDDDGGYAKPFRGWDDDEGWKAVLERLRHFEQVNGSRIRWVPLNGNISNDGATSINAYAGHALIERVTNAVDAVIELKALEDPGPKPLSPREAVQRYFKIGPEDMTFGMDDLALRAIAKSQVVFRSFVRLDPTKHDPKDAIFDFRDYGCGQDPQAMPRTFLSINAGNKREKPYQTGKHGQGAANTFQFSILTGIATRRAGGDKVGLTFVRREFLKDAAGNKPRTPTFVYMILDDQIMEIPARSLAFDHGSLIRHFGYDNTYANWNGDDSIYGLTNKLFARTPLPIWTEARQNAESSKGEDTPVGPWYCRGFLARGTINALDRYRHITLHGSTNKRSRDIIHESHATYELPPYDFGDKIMPIGSVTFRWYVSDPREMNRKREIQKKLRKESDALKNLVDPNNPVLFTNDGQTHAEMPRHWLTSQSGAGLWLVGKYMVVQADCDDLDVEAKYELFPASREALKNCPLKHLILKELVRRIQMDQELWRIQNEMIATKAPDDGQRDINFADALNEYHRSANINFPKMLRRQVVEEERDADGPGRHGRKELTPIPPQEPPTFIRWQPSPADVRMSGDSYGWRIETDAPATYYDTSCAPSRSRIVITTTGNIRCKGGDAMHGGRAMIHFERSAKAKTGDRATAIALLYWSEAAPPYVAQLAITLTEAKESRSPPGPNPRGCGTQGGSIHSNGKVKTGEKKTVEVWVDFLRPEPITRSDIKWEGLGWGEDPAVVGYATRMDNGEVRLYYNAELPLFCDFSRQLAPYGLGDDYQALFEYKLVTHVALAYNHDRLEEDMLSEDEKRRWRAYLSTVLNTLAIDSFHEIKLRREKEVAA